MGHRYQHLVFDVKALDRQRAVGSIVAYGNGLRDPDSGPQSVQQREIRLPPSVLQFHMATVTPHGWPYIHYRSGPRGFLYDLGNNRIGFPDFHGNQQFVSVDNIEVDSRVALFIAEYQYKSG